MGFGGGEGVSSRPCPRSGQKGGACRPSCIRRPRGACWLFPWWRITYPRSRLAFILPVCPFEKINFPGRELVFPLRPSKADLTEEPLIH